MKASDWKKVLLAFSLAWPSAATAGDYVFAPGVSLTEGWYDVNKAYTPVVPYWKFVIENGTGSVKVDSDRMKKEFPYDDTKHCSAAAASNLLHSWWDRNRAVCEELYGPVSGVRTAYTGSRDKYSAQNSEIFRWYIQHWQGVGNPFDVKMKQYFFQDYFQEYFPSYSSNISILGIWTMAFHNSLSTLTNQVQGLVDRGPVALTVNIGGFGHAITCWGYTLNGEGLLESLLVTDSDDSMTGLAQLLVSQEKNNEGNFVFTGARALDGAAFLEREIVVSSSDTRKESVSPSLNYKDAYVMQFFSLNDMALPTPEPSSALFLLAGCALAWKRRR